MQVDQANQLGMMCLIYTPDPLHAVHGTIVDYLAELYHCCETVHCALHYDYNQPKSLVLVNLL